MGLPENINAKNPHRLYDGINYKEFWSGAEKYKLDIVEHLIVNDLLPATGNWFVDFGCGYGRLADCYMDRFKNVVMVDGSLTLMQQARRNTDGKATYILCDVNRTPFKDAAFDSVLMVRVFHHIADSVACLQEIRRIICGGGRLVMTYHNKQNPARYIKWLLRMSDDNPYNKEPTGIGTTFLSHHPEVMEKLYSENGFGNIQYRGVGVIEKISSRLAPKRKKSILGYGLAPFLGRAKWAQWIFNSLTVVGPSTQLEAKNISDILHCPLCKGNLVQEDDQYGCGSCDRQYPIIDGILDFRIDNIE